MMQIVERIGERSVHSLDARSNRADLHKLAGRRRDLVRAQVGVRQVEFGKIWQMPSTGSRHVRLAAIPASAYLRRERSAQVAPFGFPQRYPKLL
jgi:hypothetical protein